jgi:hypothetical protein
LSCLQMATPGPRYSWRVCLSCSTSGTHQVTKI